MRLTKPSSKLGIQISLVWLVLGAIAPLILFGATAAWNVYHLKESATEAQLAGVADSLSVAVDAELVSQLRSMSMLAADDSLDSGNFNLFSDRAKRAVTANGTWISAALIDPQTGHILAGGPFAPNASDFTLSPESVRQVVTTQKPMIVGAFAQGRLSPGPIILLMAPIIRHDKVSFVLGVAMQPDTLNTLLAEGIPPGWTGVALDARLVIAGRSKEAKSLVGAEIKPAFSQQVQSALRGMFKSVTVDGQTLLTVFRRSPVHGWTVAVGVPASEVNEPILGTLSKLGLGATAMLVLAAIVATVIGRAIAAQSAQLTDALDRLKSIADSVPGVVYQFLRRPDGGYCFPYASDAIRGIYRVSPEEVRNNADKVFEVLHPDDRLEVMRQISQSADQLSTWKQEYRVRYADGTVRWLLGDALPHVQADGGVLWHGFITDITQRKEADAATAAEQKKFERILESAADAIFITNAHGHYQYVNLAATELLGFTRSELLAMHITSLTPAEDLDGVMKEFEELVRFGHLRTELRLKRKDGSLVPVSMNATVLPDGTVYGACRDISERNEMEAQVRKLAFNDALTQLPNRRLLIDRMKVALATSARSGKYGALLFLDLDNFKPLNDSHGHAAGDLLLIEVANRIKGSVREVDTVARFGGDEFVILVGELSTHVADSKDQALAVAEKIRLAVAQPYRIALETDSPSANVVEHHCTACVGVALFINHQSTVDDILKHADRAMYMAKETGRNKVCFAEV